MANKFVTGEGGRSRTAPLSVHNPATERRYRAGSAPLTSKRYVPTYYRHRDPELTKRLEAFLRQPPLNSLEHFEMSSIGVVKERPASTEKGRPHSIHTGQRSRAGSGNSSVRSIPHTKRDSSASGQGNLECEKKFKYLLPEKRTIHQMILPPILAGCRNNFSHSYKNNTAEDEQQFVENHVARGDFAEQMERLQYCRYLRCKPHYDAEITREQTETRER